MAGNPYHDAQGRFCSKDSAMESYESEISMARSQGDLKHADSLQKDYEDMMIEADPQSDVAQKALERDYGMVSRISAPSREDKKLEKRLDKADASTEKLVNKFEKQLDGYRQKGHSEEAALKKMRGRGGNSRVLVEDRSQYHPDYMEYPSGEKREVPVSEAMEGDLVTIALRPSGDSDVLNYTARIKKLENGSICLHNEDTTVNSFEAGHVIGESIEDVRNRNHNSGNANIRSVIRDEAAEDFVVNEEMKADGINPPTLESLRKSKAVSNEALELLRQAKQEEREASGE